MAKYSDTFWAEMAKYSDTPGVNLAKYSDGLGPQMAKYSDRGLERLLISPQRNKPCFFTRSAE